MHARHDAAFSATNGERDGEGLHARSPVVVVVDDDPSTVELLAEVAHAAGWLVRSCGRLAELTGLLDRQRPDLIILDDDLPDGRGGDLARQLRDDGRMAGVPVLVCTAAHPMRLAEIGAWAPVVAKPFDIAEIEAFLDAARRRVRQRRQYQAAG